MKKNDGGPAFPVPMEFDINGLTYPATHSEGMSLRDWYKGKALLGLLAGGHAKGMPPIEVAIWAGKYADAMIEERKA